MFLMGLGTPALVSFACSMGAFLSFQVRYTNDELLERVWESSEEHNLIHCNKAKKPSPSARLLSRLDILVVVKEIRRIVSLLERSQPLVVACIGDSHPLFPFLAQVVDVGSARPGLHGVPEG